LVRGRLIAIFTMLAFVVALPATADAKPKAKAAKFGSRTLKRGSHGRDVRVLQDYLTQAGYRTTVDGQFGYGTQRTVKQWEGSANLKVDGKVTRSDAKVLRSDVEAAPKSLDPASTTTDDDVESPDYQPPLDVTGTGGAGFVQTSKATLNPDGTATPPTDAPQAVIDIIEAGNEIAAKPYKYGGGHGKWIDSGYDCSGSVSYALHGAGLLKKFALDSTGFESWGAAGPGTWVTIFANAGHAYMTVAGLRFDTSGASSRKGSRWTDEMRSSKGFVVRHPVGL
jgi:peptidoglycan hydrolase-like protein with peptidoglycan-binding domain